MPAKLNSSQLRRHVGGKGLRWLLLPTAYVLICRNGIPGSTGDCVAGSSAAYENQALVIVIKKLCGLPDLLRSVSCLYCSPPHVGQMSKTEVVKITELDWCEFGF